MVQAMGSQSVRTNRLNNNIYTKWLNNSNQIK